MRFKNIICCLAIIIFVLIAVYVTARGIQKETVMSMFLAEEPNKQTIATSIYDAYKFPKYASWYKTDYSNLLNMTSDEKNAFVRLFVLYLQQGFLNLLTYIMYFYIFNVL